MSEGDSGASQVRWYVGSQSESTGSFTILLPAWSCNSSRMSGGATPVRDEMSGRCVCLRLVCQPALLRVLPLTCRVQARRAAQRGAAPALEVQRMLRPPELLNPSSLDAAYGILQCPLPVVQRKVGWAQTAEPVEEQ